MSKSWTAFWIQFWILESADLPIILYIVYLKFDIRTFNHQICSISFSDNFLMPFLCVGAHLNFLRKSNCYNSNGSCVLPCSNFTFHILPHPLHCWVLSVLLLVDLFCVNLISNWKCCSLNAQIYPSVRK